MVNVGDNLCDGIHENDLHMATDQKDSSSSLKLRHANTLCPKGRKIIRPRSRSYSTPGCRSQCHESDFFFAPHLDLDRQILFDPKKVELDDDHSDAENEQSLDDLDQQYVEEEETSF